MRVCDVRCLRVRVCVYSCFGIFFRRLSSLRRARGFGSCGLSAVRRKYKKRLSEACDFFLVLTAAHRSPRNIICTCCTKSQKTLCARVDRFYPILSPAYVLHWPETMWHRSVTPNFFSPIVPVPSLSLHYLSSCSCGHRVSVISAVRSRHHIQRTERTKPTGPQRKRGESSSQ